MAFYNATGGANWTNNTNWLSTTEPVGNWHGVQVYNERVIALRLSNNQLTGTIPTQLGNLAELRFLYLRRNQLTGGIPAEFGNLANLEQLAVDNNQLTGPLPRSLTNLENLFNFQFANGTTGLCAPSDSAFQDWLQSIRTTVGPNCSADNYSIPARTPLTYPKAGSVLDDLISRVASGEITAQQAAQEAPLHRGDAVAVTIRVQSANVNGVVTFLQSNGVTPRNQGEDYVEAFVPIRLLGTVSQQTGVLRMRMIQPPEPDQMAVPGNGPAVHGSPAWNSAGYRGQGIKVGIIDGGFTGLIGLVGTELPAIVQASCYTSASDSPTSTFSACETSFHGTAVAESVLDIAPGVELYIANPMSGGDLQDAVDWMITHGVDVINHSASHRFRAPGDGTSPFADSPLKAVDRAVDNGIVWVNSAGNAAQMTWFKRAPFSYSSLRYIRFEGSDSSNSVSLRKGQRIRVQLRWDDNWTTGATSDLGIYIGNSSTLKLLKSADNWQDGTPGQIPFEFLTFVAPSDGEYDLLVKRWSGTEPDWIQLTVWGRPTLEHSTANGSIGNPGESANPGMLTVGAAHWNAVNTIESYSSQGPLPDGRIKPDVVGAACGQTVAYGSDPFCGTSQASPHVAGMAALVRQRFPKATTAQVVEYLKENAQQRVSSPDPNNTWGHGFAVLPPISPHTVSCTNGTTVPNPADNPDLVRDCEALLSSRDQLRGSASLNWTGSNPITMWEGIVLRGFPRRVTRLDLYDNQLTGTLPTELGKLTKLEELYLHNNQLTGTIPTQLGNLANLRDAASQQQPTHGTHPDRTGQPHQPSGAVSRRQPTDRGYSRSVGQTRQASGAGPPQ